MAYAAALRRFMTDTSPLAPFTGRATVAVPAATPSPTPARNQPQSTAKAFFRAKIGPFDFNSTTGVILRGSYVWLSTDRFSQARVLLDDPDASILAQIASQTDVEVELGYVEGPKRNKFVGKIMRFGRRPPSTTIVYAADPSVAMQNEVGSGAIFSADKPAEAIAQTVQSAPTGVSTSSPGLAAALSQLDKVSSAASGGKASVTAAEQLSVTNPDLRFASNTSFSNNNQGTAVLQQSQMQTAVTEAVQQGDRVVTRGNTVRQVQPGRGDPSGLTLDYNRNRSAFIGKPEVLKRTPLQLMSGYGQLTVMGYSVNDKRTVGATIVVPTDAPPHPTGNIVVPDWGNINLSEPLFPGSSFTWNDATRNGTRVPTREIMQRIVAIAQAIQPLVDRTVGPGKKWRINSWYRTPEANRRAGGARASRHLVGDAVDVSGFDFASLHAQLRDSWNGGLATKRGAFLHLDLGSRRRWTY